MNFKNRLTLPGILFVTIVVMIGLSRGYRWTRGPASTSTEKQMESGRPSPTASALVAESYARLPLSFEINHGQTDPRVKFLSRGSGYTLFLTRNEAVLALAGANQTSKAEGRKAETRFSRLDTRSSVQLAGRGRLLNGTKNDKIGPADVLRMQLVNANSAAKVSGAEQLPGKSNYFLGNDPMKWRTNIPTYAKVKYEGVYRGIDLVYYGNQHQLEYDFVVAPGADPRAIRLAFESASQTGRMPAIDSDGNLRVRLNDTEVVFHKPVVYQPVAANLRSHAESAKLVDGGYRLQGDHNVTFEVASYDHSKPLIIDPVLSYSSYLGGSSQDAGPSVSIAVDPAGNAYVASGTISRDFPVTSGSFQAGFGGAPAICDWGELSICGDAFVTKINSAGTAIVYSTYLGGSSVDYAFGLTVDAAGNAYVSGDTESTDFPVTTGSFQPIYGGAPAVCKVGQFCGDTFVTKLNPSGSALVYSSYLGGSGNDASQAIIVDSSGNAYVTGTTDSANFPTTPGAFQTHFTGNDTCSSFLGNRPCENAYVTKINPAGTALVYSTYLGGSTGDDQGNGIAVDASGHAVVTGGACSTDFPVTITAFQLQNGGGCDIFLTTLDATGSKVLYSTYLGGNGYDVTYAVALDSFGNAYLTGPTFSANFPVTPGAIQTSYGGNGDAFVAKINPHLSGAASLVYSTFLGGSAFDGGVGVAVDSYGHAFVSGGTNSTDFPPVRPLQAANAGGGDTFVAEVSPTGSALVYSTFIGGSNSEYGDSLAVDSHGNAYVAGPTQSADFPTTPHSFQPKYAGGLKDVFVVKIGPESEPGVSIVPTTLTFPRQAIGTTSPPQTVLLHNVGSKALGIEGIHTVGAFAQTNTCGGSLAGGGSCAISIVFTPRAPGMQTGAVVVNDDAQGSPQELILTGTGAAEE